jgi:hypothetical protein
MERQESVAKANLSQRFSVVAKPPYESIGKTGDKMDWTFLSDRKDKIRIV